MITKVERKSDSIFIWDGAGSPPIILDHDDAFDLAQALLEACGRMKQEIEEEIVA